MVFHVFKFWNNGNNINFVTSIEARSYDSAHTVLNALGVDYDYTIPSNELDDRHREVMKWVYMNDSLCVSVYALLYMF